MKAGGESSCTLCYVMMADLASFVALLPDDIVLKLVEPELRALKDKVRILTRLHILHTNVRVTGLDPRWIPTKSISGDSPRYVAGQLWRRIELCRQPRSAG